MKKGFTLVEIVLVLAIMSVIATIAIPQVNKYLDRANRTKVISALSELNNSSLSWSIENNGNIPEKLDDILKLHGDIKKLNISLEDSGTFKVGNIKGKLVLNDGEVNAEIDHDSKSFGGEIVTVRW